MAIAHKRLTDDGATTSKALEVLCFLSLLASVRMVVYATVVMDGCRDLLQDAKANGKRSQGDLWHLGKNWVKWARLAIPLLCRRPPKDASEKAANPRVEAVKLDPARLEEYGDRPQGSTALEWAQQRVGDLEASLAAGGRRSGLGEATAELNLAGLKLRFRQLATMLAMTASERRQQAQHEAYKAEQARRKEAGKERSQQGDAVTAAKKLALPWVRDLRSMLRYIAEHTRGLRSEVNPSTSKTWTDGERGAEFLRLWHKGCVALVLGRTTDPILLLLKHPITDTSRETPWKPPGSGFVLADSFAFNVLDSLIRDPAWDTKFPFLTDGRMTFMNESFFHALRKWGNKHSHFSRFYSIAIWCALLQWNENVTRSILEHVWSRRKSGQLKSSAGRAYRVPVRPPQTDRWRRDGWELYLQSVQGKEPPPASASAPLRSYDLGWYGPDPPRLSPLQTAPAETAAAPLAVVDAMTAPALRAELAAQGLSDKGRKGELQLQVAAARADIAAVRIAQAVPLARRPLPDMPRGSPRRQRSDVVLPLHGLPSPYRLPATQRQKRKAPPPGQKQYTAGRLAASLATIAAGGVSTPLKRSRVQPDELVESGSVELEGEGEGEDVCSGAEGEEGEEEMGEEMED